MDPCQRIHLQHLCYSHCFRGFLSYVGGVYWRLKSSLDLITEQLQLVRPPLEAIQPQTVFAEIGPILNVKI